MFFERHTKKHKIFQIKNPLCVTGFLRCYKERLQSFFYTFSKNIEFFHLDYISVFLFIFQSNHCFCIHLLFLSSRSGVFSNFNKRENELSGSLQNTVLPINATPLELQALITGTFAGKSKMHLRTINCGVPFWSYFLEGHDTLIPT